MVQAPSSEFSYFKTYAVVTQKKRLNEAVLLGTQNKCFITDK